MMKTVAFLLLLSSTNAARSDNLISDNDLSELTRSKSFTNTSRNQLSMGHDQDRFIQPKQVEPEVIPVEQIEEQLSQHEEVQKDVPSQLIQPEEVQNDATEQLNQQEEVQGDVPQHEADDKVKQNMFQKFGSIIKERTLKAGGFVTDNAKKVGGFVAENAVKAKKCAGEHCENMIQKTKGYGHTVSERSTKLAGLVKNLHARAIVAAVVVAFLWVAVPWFIVRPIMALITSPRGGVISALVTMFVATPVAVIVVLSVLSEESFEKVEAFLKEPIFGTKENSPKVEIIQVNEVEDVDINQVTEENNEFDN